VLALGGGEDKIGGGLDRARLVSFAGLDFELAADALTNERLARVARPRAAALEAASASSLAASRFAAVSPVVITSGAHSTGGDRGSAPELTGRPPAATPSVTPASSAGSSSPSAGATPSVSAGAGALCWQWRRAESGEVAGGVGEVLTRFGQASVAERPEGVVARVSLAEDPRAAHLVLSGLAALLLHRRGGCILHSASVALEGRVIAFVGPSGAGKSTACRHVTEAQLFSVDRLALLPVLAGAASPAEPPRRAPGADAAGSNRAGADMPVMWFAHPLPGGTRSALDLPSAPESWLPLAGVLRVVRGEQGAAVRSLTGASAVLALRESAFQIGSGASAEVELLSTLEALAHTLPVGRLELALGACLAPELRRWLVDQTEEYR
jgi:hypothetical protein